MHLGGIGVVIFPTGLKIPFKKNHLGETGDISGTVVT